MGSMGGGGKPPEPAPVAAPVTAEEPEVQAASDAVRKRIVRQQGRQSTFNVSSGGSAAAPRNRTGQ